MATPDHIAVVDDEAEIRATLVEYLRLHGFHVSECADGAALRALLASERIDLALLDLRMPGEDGLSLARHLRATTDAGVIMLTAIAEPVDRVIGLELGADDYIAKPFELREVVARVRSVLRRRKPASSTPAETDTRRLGFAGYILDLDRRTLTRADGTEVVLTAMEFDLLAVLARRPGIVFTREQLQDLAHNNADETFDRSIDIRITRLRKKIEVDPARPAILKTVRGAGYMLADG